MKTSIILPTGSTVTSGDPVVELEHVSFDHGRDRAAAEDALETVGMLELRARPIGRLSAGQQQRVFIARALASRPELLLLDEPTVGVDVDAQEQFYSLLRRLNREFGTTLVLVS